MRKAYIFAVLAFAGGVAAGQVVEAPLMVVHNPSPSMPVGWYLRLPVEPDVGRIVVIDPPTEAIAHGWPEGVRLMKPVVAKGRDHVCLRNRTTVLINGRSAAPLRSDFNWNGCRSLEPDELFLLAPDRIDSVDGRVFGPIPRSAVVAVVTPIWTEKPE